MAQGDTRTNFSHGVDCSDGTNGGLYANGTQVIDADGTLLVAPDIDVSGVTTGIGLALDNNTGLTSGQLVAIASSATAIATTGRLLKVSHSGATSTSGILTEFSSAANDETKIVKITASDLLATGQCLAISAALMTTGKAIVIGDLDALTSGMGIHVASAATAITGAGRLLLVDHTGATGTSATLNEFKTAANDETILLALTAAALTTGTVLDFGTTAALTTGVGLKIAHTTSVLADGGSLVRISSSSIDTGGATNGTLLDLKSTAQVAGTLVRLDTVATTGTGMSIIGTGTMTTTGNLLTLTANSATTAAGLLRVNGNGLTSGIGVVITSSATAITGAGRLFRSDHTGATSTGAILNEFASASTDDPTVLRVTASGALAAGTLLDLSGAAVTTGTILDLGGLNGLTTGTAINVVSNSADATARTLVNIHNDHASAAGVVPLKITQDAVVSTNFKLLITLGTISIYTSNETSPNTALTAAKGSICLNGSATGQAFWNTDGSTAWTALA